MAKFAVKIEDSALYFNINAENEEMAIQIASEWFQERKPYVNVTKMEEGGDCATCDYCGSDVCTGCKDGSKYEPDYDTFDEILS